MAFFLDGKTASQAVDYEITIWRERMIDVIDDVDAPSITEPKAKAAFWLGLGFNAANHVFPEYTPNRVVNSQVGRLSGTILKRVAMPVWVMSEVQSYFSDRYADRIKKGNELLFSNHTQFRDTLVDQIVNKARVFIDSDYGRLCSSALVRHFQGHQFSDPAQAVSRARKLLRDAGMVVSEREVLRDMFAPGLEAMVNKVELIAKACPSSPAQRKLFSTHRQRLYYSPSGDQEWVSWMGGPAQTRYSDLIRITDPAQALRLMTYAYRMDVLTGSRVYPDTSPYAVYVTTVVQKYPNRTIEDFIPSFETAEPEIMEALKAADRAPVTA